VPVIELDMLIAFVNPHDKLHDLADKLFSRIAAGKVKVAVASSALLEYELLLRSRGYPEREIRSDIEAFRTLLPDVPISSTIIIKASEIRERYGLTYFDSLHAASAIIVDGIIISTDRDYEKVREIQAIKPEDFLAKL
jgi:predicted nucleic acid-binding protein